MARKKFYMREYKKERNKSFIMMNDDEIRDYYMKAKINNHYLSIQRLIVYLEKNDKMDVIEDIM